MLYFETLDQSTLDLLKTLQRFKSLKNARLVGGTSLALQIGHRISVDLDLFASSLEDDFLSIVSNIKESGNRLEIRQQTSRILVCLINDVKVDIVNYPFEWIDAAREEDGILLASTKEIAAMKLSAITNRGTKKDFIDLYYLLQEFSMSQMLSFYRLKYSDNSMFSVLKSLCFFEDAELDIMPKMMDKTLSWEQVKQRINSETTEILGKL